MSTNETAEQCAIYAQRIMELERELKWTNENWSQVNKTCIALRDEVQKLQSLMYWFCDRVERGEIRSTRTYRAFKDVLKDIK